jgi:ornithine decarboxylase
LNAQNWHNAIRACGAVWTQAAERGHRFTFLDIGGGYPAGHYHTPSIPTIEEIGAVVMDSVRKYIPNSSDPDFILDIEPGRGMVGESGRLLATVVGKAIRRTVNGDQTWLYMDVGVFNGLMETYEGFPPVVRPLANTDRPLKTYTLAGPSCDSCDVVARDIQLPEINVGDRLVFYDTGAYTNEYAAAFNGFPIPEVINLYAEPDAFASVLVTADESGAFAPV